MKHTYAILGAGMQGTAAAYDLAQFGDAERILLADANLEQAQKSADRVNGLLNTSVCSPVQVDVLNDAELLKLLQPVDVVLSCVPYWMHPQIATVAIQAGTHMCDLGGDTRVTMKTLELDEQAKAAGISLVPDTGLAPGLVNSIGAYLIQQLDEPETVRLFCGVLPQHPVAPFNYKLTFNIEGLVAEYDDNAVVLRDGEVGLIPTLHELETIQIEGLGEMEAFTTSGGTSTAPYSFQNKLSNYEYKTIRFPGHCERMRVFKDFGFWSQEPVMVDGVSVVPRKLWFNVFGEALRQFEDVDQCIVRGQGWGKKGGRDVMLQVDIHDKQDEATGFTSMERLTGFSISIHAIAMAKEQIPTGAIRYELAMSGADFLKEIQRRGIALRFSEERSAAESATMA